jgi:hypothetical protein
MCVCTGTGSILRTSILRHHTVWSVAELANELHIAGVTRRYERMIDQVAVVTSPLDRWIFGECKRGHILKGKSAVYVRLDGARVCRWCSTEDYRARKRTEKVERDATA